LIFSEICFIETIVCFIERLFQPHFFENPVKSPIFAIRKPLRCNRYLIAS